MNDIEVKCSACQSDLMVPAELAGTQAECPNCGELISINAPVKKRPFINKTQKNGWDKKPPASSTPPPNREVTQSDLLAEMKKQSGMINQIRLVMVVPLILCLILMVFLIIFRAVAAMASKEDRPVTTQRIVQSQAKSMEPEMTEEKLAQIRELLSE